MKPSNFVYKLMLMRNGKSGGARLAPAANPQTCSEAHGGHHCGPVQLPNKTGRRFHREHRFIENCRCVGRRDKRRVRRVKCLLRKRTHTTP